MESLGLNRPFVVGHSLGGQELSSIGSRYPKKVAGLIYLDAGYQYAYYDRSKGSINIEVNEVRRKLEQLEPGKGPLDLKALINELLETNLPELERTLRQIQEGLRNAPSPQASAQVLPQTRPIDAALRNGGQRYTDIRAPALAIYAFEPLPKPDGSRARRIVEYRNQTKRDQAAAFEAGVPSARVVRLENASHDVFRSNSSEVLREIDDFVRSLSRPGASPNP
jgi:pimeloyl-ACP methyl ester carboxylesterase